ncbi:P-selectin [Eptesicus fuscus]|uniref:P-selectin n=1 Tax=Eptesicus fuscus TaxID=29078 RepID=UPI0024044D97|nr:P-selectin [Eptesicus fuscus]
MARCPSATWNWRSRGVVFIAAQILRLSALLSELMNQTQVAAWTYHIGTKAYPWDASRKFCQKYFTDLVAIQNKDEIAYLNDVIPYYSHYYWIGIRKINNKWTWVGTNKTLTQEAENWADHEPNNKKNNQDCVEIYIKSPSAPGRWNDEPCLRRKRPLCYTASCQDTSCSQHGECVETIGNYTCSCHPGFYGPECEYVRECGGLELPSRVLMDCSHPLGSFSFNSRCSFHCAEGYTLDGPRELECLASGTWTNQPPQCVAIACEPPEGPAHGSVDCPPSSRALPYNATCRFRCAEGFELHGADTVRCADEGQWTAPAPLCQALQCQDLPAPNQARVECVHPFGASRYQSTCSFACAEGFLLVGARELRCLATGSWSAAPPECQAITCTPLRSPQNGTMTCVSPLGDSSYRSTCQFTCNEGFSLSGPERLDCTPSGHWTASPPTCAATRCPELSAPERGSLDCSDTRGEFGVGSTCRFSCRGGFELQGSGSVQCTASGRWTAPPPTCQATRCPELSAPERGSLDCSDTRGEFGVGSTCRFSCRGGFELQGSGSVQCTASGRWTAPPPTCQGAAPAPPAEVRCPALVAPGQGDMSCRHPLAAFGLNSTCHFECHAGFELRGEAALRCARSGRWTAATPACRAVQCSELHMAEPVLMNCSSPWGNFSYGATCTFHCPEGRALNGSAAAACGPDGQWSAATPTCDAGPLTVQEALTYLGGAVASTTGLVMGGTLLALLRRRCRRKDDGKDPLNPHSHLGTYGVFTNAAFDPSP